MELSDPGSVSKKGDEIVKTFELKFSKGHCVAQDWHLAGLSEWWIVTMIYKIHILSLPPPTSISKDSCSQIHFAS
jgi:hypothetical protein